MRDNFLKQFACFNVINKKLNKKTILYGCIVPILETSGVKVKTTVIITLINNCAIYTFLIRLYMLTQLLKR